MLTSEVWTQSLLLLAAFVLCSLIGLERQLRQKNAGYRTHVLVGLGSCVFTLISMYGFTPLGGGEAPADPARIAAQVVSGIGFLGAGVIFKGRNVVRGLTTAATVWVAAAVGMACGSGLVPLAVVLTVLHLVTLFLVAPWAHRLPSPDRRRTVRVIYRDGAGVLRHILKAASDMGFTAAVEGSHRMKDAEDDELVAVSLRFVGRRPLHVLMSELAELPGVQSLQLRKDRDDPLDDSLE